MKFLAVLQLACILFVSSAVGMQNCTLPVVKITCCEKMAKDQACHPQKNNQKGNCNNDGCCTMSSCSICGFVTTERLAIKPVFFASIEKPVPVYKIGNLSGYFASDWKPPKV